MNRSRFRRGVAIILIGLAVIAVATWAAIRFLDGQITYSDQTVDVELISPATPAPPAPPEEN
ncbi:MAG: hypothetical protein Q8M32_12395 [Brevundimonas sp.]|nr:hypothetical protein [Brevundimonas sp.]